MTKSDAEEARKLAAPTNSLGLPQRFAGVMAFTESTRWGNLYINTGHGTLGWTMACGSGRVIADLVSGQAPDIDISDLAVSRS